MNTFQQEQLAQEIAAALEDADALPFYRNCAADYEEALLRRILAKVLSIPQDKIKKSRGALFTHLLYGHTKSNTDTHRAGHLHRHP